MNNSTWNLKFWFGLGLLGAFAGCSVNTKGYVFDDAKYDQAKNGGLAGGGGDSNGTGGGDGTGGGGEIPCVHGAPGCDGNQPQVCASGIWFPEGAPCDFVCINGACSGSCVPDSGQCVSETESQTCNAAGKWDASVSCTYGCIDGKCGGECVPGSRECNVDGDVAFCDETAHWTVEADCGSGGCSNSLCLDCVENAIQCTGATTYKQCSGGSWGSNISCTNQACAGNACVGVCSPGSSRCKSGVNNVVETCGTNGEFTTEFKCDYVCSSGECSGECVPGAYRCSGDMAQKCNTSGKWADAKDCAAGGNSCSQVGDSVECVACKDGQTRCGATGYVQYCKGGSFIDDYTCDQKDSSLVCFQGECVEVKEVCSKAPDAIGCQNDSVFFNCPKEEFLSVCPKLTPNCYQGSCYALAVQ